MLIWTVTPSGPSGACFSKVPVNFRTGKLLCVCRVYIQDQSFDKFEKSKTKLSVNEAKLSGLWAKNCATIQQVCLRARFRAFPETGPWWEMVRRTGSEFSEKGKNPKLFRLLNFLFPRRVVVSLCSLLLYFDRRFVRRFLVGQRFQCLASVELSLFRLQSVLGKSTQVGLTETVVFF